MAKVIAIGNNKGGIGKTTTSVSLATGLQKKERGFWLSIMIHKEISLKVWKLILFSTMNREQILKEYVTMMRPYYDYIIIDCMPSLGLLTVNAFTAADSILIPVTPEVLPVDGLQQLLQTIGMIKRKLNQNLMIEGILFTMVDKRTKDKEPILLETEWDEPVYETDWFCNVCGLDLTNNFGDLYSGGALSHTGVNGCQSGWHNEDVVVEYIHHGEVWGWNEYDADEKVVDYLYCIDCNKIKEK